MLNGIFLNHKISQTFTRKVISTRIGEAIFSVTISCNLVVLSLASEVSLRIKGMGRELAGIVSDSETDILKNPARLGEMRRSEVLALFEPRIEGRESHPGIAFKSFFPGSISSRSGFGFRGEGTENKFSTSGPQIYEPNSFSSSTVESRSFLITPFFSWNPTSNLGLGIRYDYGRALEDQEGREEYERIVFDPSTNDTFLIDQDVRKSDEENKLNNHILQMGMISDVGVGITLEVLGKLTLVHGDSVDYIERESIEFSKSEWTSTSSDSVTYNSNQLNFSRETLQDRNLLLEGKEMDLGFRVSRIVSDKTVLRLIGNVGKGLGNLSGNNENAANVTREDYFTSFIVVADTETTSITTSAETLYSISEGLKSITGDWDFFSTSLGVGLEHRVSNRVLLGVALKGFYSRDIKEWEEKGPTSSRSDTTVAETTFVITETEDHEKAIRTAGNILLPIGVEFALHYPDVLLRFGIIPEGKYEVVRTESEDLPIQTTLEQNLTLDYTIGLGYHFSEDLVFNVFFSDLVSSFKDWDVEVIYRF